MGLIAIVIHPPPPPRNNARLISMQTLFKYIRICYCIVYLSIAYVFLKINLKSKEDHGMPAELSITRGKKLKITIVY